MGEWDAEAVKPGKEHVTIAVSGARGGHTVDFRRLADEGITLVGLTQSFNGSVVTFEPNLAENIARGDENYLALLDAADAYIARNGLDLPLEPEARHLLPDPQCMTQPILELDLVAAGVTSVIWATGYSVDYSWLKVDALGADGKPRHQRGVPASRACISSACPGCHVEARRSSGVSGMTPAHCRPHREATHLPRLPRCRPAPGPGPEQRFAPFENQSLGSPLMPTHTRIRMFNTKDTYPNQTLDNDLCQAVRAGNTVYVRGQVGTDFNGQLVGLGDPRAQAEQAMRNVKQLLEEAGSDLSHIVKTTTYLIDPRYREPVYQEVGKWLKGVFPISTGLVVSALGQPQWLMEIDVIAVIPE